MGSGTIREVSRRAHLPSNVGFSHGSPGTGTESGHRNQPLPSHLIRVMPAKGAEMSPGTVAVVGGGVIGLSVARRAALDGWSVRVHRTEDRGASWVAGGMLAPHSEGWPGEEKLLQLGLASLRMWHEAHTLLSACAINRSRRVLSGLLGSLTTEKSTSFGGSGVGEQRRISWSATPRLVGDERPG